jgi:hypothetical protein
LAAVVCGHSHRSVRLRLPCGGLPAVMNVRGYASEIGRSGYSSRATFRV